MAGPHLVRRARTAIFREIVRTTRAPRRGFVSDLAVVRYGRAQAPTAPGVAAALRPKMRGAGGAVVRDHGTPLRIRA